jgi:hypothetical protein
MQWRCLTGGQRVLWALVLSGALLPAAMAQVVFRDVQGQGCGGDEPAATLEALQGALAQVGGMRLKVDVAMQMQETVRIDSASMESSFRQNVERATRGIIKSYRVVDKKVSAGSGQLCVTLVATIPSYRPSEQLKRLKLAVVPVTVHPQLARIPDARKFADDVSSAIEAHLTGTRRFAMLDRRFGAQTQRELSNIIGGATPIEETVKLGLSAGADYIVLASLRDFSAQASEGRSPLGRPTTRLTAPVVIDVRVIDIATRQIKFAQAYTNRGRLPPGYGLNEHAQDIGHEIGETISTAIFPIAVVAVSGPMVTFNQGGDTVQVGRQYRLVVLGRNLVDPYTKESLGQEELEVGVAEVTAVTDRTSQARLVSGNLTEVKGQLLARAAPDGAPESPSATPDRAKPMTGHAPSTGGVPGRPKGDNW